MWNLKIRMRFFLLTLATVVASHGNANDAFSSMMDCSQPTSIDSVNSLKAFDDVVLAKVKSIDLVSNKASEFLAGLDPLDPQKRPLYSVKFESIEKFKGGFKNFSIKVPKVPGDGFCYPSLLVDGYNLNELFLLFVKRHPNGRLRESLCCTPSFSVKNRGTLDGYRSKLKKLLEKK